MRIGLFLAYWPWFSFEEQIGLARQADREGLDSVWVSEAWGQDAATVLGHMSAVTERVALGSGLFQIPARSPAMTAMTAATLDTMSGGRFRLGLGVSGPQVSEGWHGASFARPLARTREYVEIVRTALAREGPLEYAGQEFQPSHRGHRARQAAQAADPPLRARTSRSTSARSGPRRSSRPARSPTAGCRSSSTPRAERRSSRPCARRAARSMCRRWRWCAWTRTSRRRATWPDPGWRSTSAAWARRARTSTSRRPSGWGPARRPGASRSCSCPATAKAAAAALPDELIDATALCCRSAELDERLADYERAGADTLLAMPFGDRPRIVEALAAAARGAAA